MSKLVKYGQSIIDIVLNSTGAINGLQTVLDNNGFDTWTPVLQPGQLLETSEIVNQAYYDYLQLYQAVNNTFTNNIDTKISDFITAISGVTPIIFDLPKTRVQNIEYYNVKQGETIFDTCLNSTGSVYNLTKFLETNLLTSWTAYIATGMQLSIDYTEIQTNVKKYLESYPASNNLSISNLDLQIQNLIDKFVLTGAKEFEDAEIFYFEDNETYLFEN